MKNLPLFSTDITIKIIIAMKRKIIYQFNIELHHIEPSIWRRIEVPYDYTFWDLHVAIQDAMGWDDSHLHRFEIKLENSRVPSFIGIPMDEDFNHMPEFVIRAGWEVPLSEVFDLPGVAVQYEYDFGDSWQHTILLESIHLAKSRVRYPKCIDGQRACPPEDCGGIWGYHNILEVLADRKHPEYADVREWVGRFDPERFDAKKVKFDNPHERRLLAFRE